LILIKYFFLFRGIPGEIKGLYDAYKIGGRLPWEDLFQPAIELCVNGFKIPNALANALSSKEKEIRKDYVLSRIFINNATNKLLKQNDTAYFLLLGETLKKISKSNTSKSNTSDIFYNSDMTKNIIAEMNENGLIFCLYIWTITFKIITILFPIKGGNVTIEDFLLYNTDINNNSIPMRLDEKHRLYYMSLPSSGILIPFIMKLMAGSQ